RNAANRSVLQLRVLRLHVDPALRDRDAHLTADRTLRRDVAEELTQALERAVVPSARDQRRRSERSPPRERPPWARGSHGTYLRAGKRAGGLRVDAIEGHA